MMRFKNGDLSIFLYLNIFILILSLDMILNMMFQNSKLPSLKLQKKPS